MSSVTRLSVAARLLAGLAVTDVADALHDPVGVGLAGIRLAVGGERQPRPAMAAEDVAGQKAVSSCVERDVGREGGGVGAGFPYSQCRLELLV